MATKFLEPGGDATFNFATTNGFWSSATATIATDVVHGNHIKSAKHIDTASNLFTLAGTISDSGTRLSVYVYLVALPSSTSMLIGLRSATQLSANLRVTSAGVLQLWNTTSAQIGTNGPTLSTGQWYRISLAYTITDGTHNRFEAFVDGVSAISVTDATITNITTSLLAVSHSDATFDFRTSDYYIDDSSALTDPGNIWVTAKRPNADGTANNWTTQIGSGGSGYGSGHSPQVNERALSVTNGWSISTDSALTEEYNIEGVSAGDIDITGATIVDYMGWVSCKTASNPDTGQIIVNGSATNISILTTTGVRTKIAGSSTYPAGTGTDIGIITGTDGIQLFSLFECGIIVAYIPATTSASPSASPSASISPSKSPSQSPSASPSVSPSSSPSQSPSASVSPSSSPSASPSVSPSSSPSQSPSASVSPSVSPSASPSVSPSSSPSQSPSASISPSASPSASPSVSPSASPRFTSSDLTITGQVALGIG